jgi:uncharacterized membrane protein HdeD (DUF308 family)
MSAGKILLSVVLGFFSPIVYIIGAEPFEARGETSVQEVLAGCIAVALYLAVCQFMATRNSSSGLRDDWLILAAMVAPLVAISFIMESSDRFLILLAGCIGCLAGAVAGHMGTPPTGGQAAWRIVLRAGAGLYLVVAAILVVAVIPAVARDTSPHATPGPAVKAFILSVAIHVSVAAFMLWRTRGGKLPVVAGVFGLILGLFLLAPASAFAHMHLAAIALWACTGIDFVVGAASLAAAAMVREPELPEGELRFP